MGGGYNDADACAAAMAELAASRSRAEAISLTGEEVRRLKTEIATAQAALAAIHDRALGFHNSHRIRRAREALTAAKAMLDSAGARATAG